MGAIDNNKEKLGHLLRYIDDCDGIDIPIHIGKAMFELRKSIASCLEPEDMENPDAQHEWGTDGQHQNEYCKKCFTQKKR